MRQAIDYVMASKGMANIWRQPLANRPAQQITNLGSEEISDFDGPPMENDCWFREARPARIFLCSPISRDTSRSGHFG